MTDNLSGLSMGLSGKRILLVITGGIAAYKCPELIRQLTAEGASVRCVLTPSAAEFVAPLALAAVSGQKVYQQLLSLTDEDEMGHIRLSREADALLVAPATANTIAKMANGIADNLATTTLLATDKPVLIAPAMNVRMWEHPATKSNLGVLRERDVTLIGPEEGDMACGEYGMGRMADPENIVQCVIDHFQTQKGPLSGYKALVTSGPTHEAIDPVRYIANRSSGKQGHAIATALAASGADVTLVTGPTQQADPKGVKTIHIQSARDMLKACEAVLPADIAICAAAVADWRVAEEATSKLKKETGKGLPDLSLTQNPDILHTLSRPGPDRPLIVVGFAAETDDIIANATVKRDKKGCDWIVANDVSPATGTFDGDHNTVHLITGNGTENWPAMTKSEVGNRLSAHIVKFLEDRNGKS